jgi:hypothetical protein
MINDVQAITPTTVEQTEVSEGRRFAHYCALEEMVGLVFGVMTVAYILMSLTGLAP